MPTPYSLYIPFVSLYLLAEPLNKQSGVCVCESEQNSLKWKDEPVCFVCYCVSTSISTTREAAEAETSVVQPQDAATGNCEVE